MCHSDVQRPDAALDGIDEDFLTFASDRGPHFASLFRPQQEPRGCVLVATDVFGRSPFYRQLGKRLAAAGFVAVVPEMFSHLWPVADGDVRSAGERLARLDRSATLEEFVVLSDHLRSTHPGQGVGVMGFCLGGALALTLANRTRLDAAVLYYATIERRPTSGLSPFTAMDELQSLRTPLLAHWGDLDEFVSAAAIAEANGILQGSGTPHQVSILPGQRHAFLTFDERDPAYAASAQSWAQSLDFLGARMMAFRGGAAN
ncbi:dienelactone hydrolase family protein [Frigidibacter sp.]|uniref:dienelactone hydrolase family protein n=1 Tax=Frigidibacter sp. TaxID=2586418 RepID=UPI0027354C09|nr:dienelactone hydrolase family protein [Frigidibacter sp.]MDP3339318.1 dienelactone hydrolase family protein [Frigidibacter sp.]